MAYTNVNVHDLNLWAEDNDEVLTAKYQLLTEYLDMDWHDFVEEEHAPYFEIWNSAVFPEF
jgi:hypothetical protein